VLDTCIFDRTTSGAGEITKNRRIKINYQGSNNYSQFTYDGFGHVVKIVETISGATTSTKQFVWSEQQMREARDVSGNPTAQYFSGGQTSGASNYFYDLNHRGDVVGVTNSSGTPVSSISYDVYGRQAILAGISISDFGFTGLYWHQRSGLNVAVYRAYSANLGRWVNRDPVGERGGINLFQYVGGEPVSNLDRNGLNSRSIITSPGEINCLGYACGLGSFAYPGNQQTPDDFWNKLHVKCKPLIGTFDSCKCDPGKFPFIFVIYLGSKNYPENDNPYYDTKGTYHAFAPGDGGTYHDFEFPHPLGSEPRTGDPERFMDPQYRRYCCCSCRAPNAGGP